MQIARIDLYSYDLNYLGGEYTMSGGRVVSSLPSTVVRVSTSDGLSGFGETCPLGSNYLPAHAAGARAALAELAPQLIGLDASSPSLVGAAMDELLYGHAYAKSAIDVACWDLLGQASGKALCDLLGGRVHESFALYAPIPLGSVEEMRANVQAHRERNIHRFQLKLGGDPAGDAERASAVIDATEPGEIVVGDANMGWSLRDAVVAARLMDGLPRFYLEQPCRTLEECLQVGQRTSLPMILDEIIVDVQSLLRAWQAQAMVGFNLKVSKVGGVTKARLMRDLAQELGLSVTIEDTWGGDIATAAVSHLAASTSRAALFTVSFMNDASAEYVAGHNPASVDGVGAAPEGAGLGLNVDLEQLGEPLVSFR